MQDATPEVIPHFRWQRLRRNLLRGIGLFVLILSVCTLATSYWYNHRPQPPETTRQLFPGVIYRRLVRQTPRPMVVHMVSVDLRTPGLEFLVTRGDPNKPRPLIARKTTEFAREFKLQVAINGDFFFPWWSHTPWDYYPHVGDPVSVQGFAASQGVVYSRRTDGKKYPVLTLDRNNRARFYQSDPVEPAWNAVAGHDWLLQKACVLPIADKELNPRTAVGLDRTHQTLYFLLVDGRQPNYSEGCSMRELAELMRAQGAHEAINLDGGGSTTLVAEEAGRLHILNSPIDNYIPGRERPVANHLGLRLRPR